MTATRLDRQRLWRIANLVGAGLLVLFWLDKGLLHPHPGGDVGAYWSVRDGVFYEGRWLQEQSGGPAPYVYSPVFAQAIWPFAQLPHHAFVALWTAVQVAAVGFLAGPFLAAVLVWTFPPLAVNNLWAGQITPILALSLVFALRFPAVWSVLLLTKVTPGVGIVWHAARREWGALAIAICATVGIIGASALLFGLDHWLTWVDVLRDATGRQSPMAVPVPLPLRVLVAAAFISLSALRGWRWAIPVGIFVAFPHGTLGNAPILLAAVYWWRKGTSLATPIAQGDTVSGRLTPGRRG